MFLFRKRFQVLPIVLSLTLTACGGAATNGASQYQDANDPYENFNRKMFTFNMTLDEYALEPVAKGYLYVPEPVRMSVRRFIDNLTSPVTLANDVLQGQWSRAGTTGARLGINTTLGLFGFFDPATSLGFASHDEDFGQTLAVYGVAEGPYLFLPMPQEYV